MAANQEGSLALLAISPNSPVIQSLNNHRIIRRTQLVSRTPVRHSSPGSLLGSLRLCRACRTLCEAEAHLEGVRRWPLIIDFESIEFIESAPLAGRPPLEDAGRRPGDFERHRNGKFMGSATACCRVCSTASDCLTN